MILASASPRRSELLRLMGLDFEIMPSGLDETVRKDETPVEHVRRLSLAKAAAPSDCHPEAWVLGADTVVVIEGVLLGKPATTDEAKMMLGKLSGKMHRVYTGVALIGKAATVCLSEVVASDVLFKELPREEVDWYAATPEPYDKAGGYAVQGRGAFFIKEIHGSYTNVIGLPLCETVDMLKAAGAINFSGPSHDN